MTKVIPVCDARLETEDRMQSAVLKRGVQTELPPGLMAVYRNKYGPAGIVGEDIQAAVIDTTPVVEEEVSTESEDIEDEAPTADTKLIAIASAINDVLDEGDESKLTSDGDVRINVLEEILNFSVTTEERNAAMDLA